MGESWVADSELIQLISHLIRPPGSIPGVGGFKRNQTNFAIEMNKLDYMMEEICRERHGNINEHAFEELY